MPDLKEWLTEKYVIELKAIDLLTICGAVVLALKHPEYKGPSAEHVSWVTAQLVNLFIDKIPPEVAAEYRRVLEEGRDYDADDELCPECGNYHPPGHRCEFYEDLQFGEVDDG